MNSASRCGNGTANNAGKDLLMPRWTQTNGSIYRKIRKVGIEGPTSLRGHHEVSERQLPPKKTPFIQVKPCITGNEMQYRRTFSMAFTWMFTKSWEAWMISAWLKMGLVCWNVFRWAHLVDPWHFWDVSWLWNQLLVLWFCSEMNLHFSLDRSKEDCHGSCRHSEKELWGGKKCSLGLLLNLTKELHGFWKAKEQNLHTWLYARLIHPFCLLVYKCAGRMELILYAITH